MNANESNNNLELNDEAACDIAQIRKQYFKKCQKLLQQISDLESDSSWATSFEKKEEDNPKLDTKMKNALPITLNSNESPFCIAQHMHSDLLQKLTGIREKIMNLIEALDMLENSWHC